MGDSGKVIPIGRAEVIGEAGGLVDETRATLAVYGLDLDPDVVSRQLGASPTSAHRRGDRRSHRSPPSKQGAWLLTVEGKAPTGPDELIRLLLVPFPRDREFWSGLRAAYNVQVCIGIHMDTWNRGFALDAETVALLETTGVEVHFDLYFDGDGEHTGCPARRS